MTSPALLRFFDGLPGRLVSHGRRALAERPLHEALLAGAAAPHLRLGADRQGLVVAAGSDPLAQDLADQSDHKLLEVSLPALYRLAGVDGRPAMAAPWEAPGPDFAREAARLEVMHAALTSAGAAVLAPPLLLRLDRRDLLSDGGRQAVSRDAALCRAAPPPLRPADLVLVTAASHRHRAPLQAALAEGGLLGEALSLAAPGTTARLALRAAAAGPVLAKHQPPPGVQRAAAVARFLEWEEALARLDGWPDSARQSPRLEERAWGWHRQACYVHAAATLMCMAAGEGAAPALIAQARARLVALAGPGLADLSTGQDALALLAPILYTTPAVEAAAAAATAVGSNLRAMAPADLLDWAGELTRQAALSPQAFIDLSRYLTVGAVFREVLADEAAAAAAAPRRPASGAGDGDDDAAALAARLTALDAIAARLDQALRDA